MLNYSVAELRFYQNIALKYIEFASFNLISTKCQPHILKFSNSNIELSFFQKLDLSCVHTIEAFFVYCKVVKEKEYSLFLNR